MPKVSYVIPSYNNQFFIEKTINHLLQQTYKDIDVWVVDDCSADISPYLVRKYGGNIHYYRHYRNLGVSAALNTGINLSDSEYIGWVSSDDYLSIYKVEEDIEILEQSGAGLIYSDFYYVNEYNFVIGQAHIEPYQDPRYQMFQNNSINGSSVIFRRELLNKVGMFDEQLGGKSGHCADGFMWHKMSFYTGFVFNPVPNTYYRIHQTQQSQIIGQSFKTNASQEYIEKMKEWIKNEGFNNTRG